MTDNPSLTLTVDGDEVTVDGTVKGDPNNKALFSGAWKWGYNAKAWVLPRNLKPLNRDYYVQKFQRDCAALGYPLTVEDTGVVQTEAERRTAREERLDARADRYENRAEKAGAEADSRWSAFKQISDGIPMGQPILVGHHSERGHRADIRRMDGHMAKMSEAMRTQERAERLAAGIRRHQESGDSPRKVKRRITRTATELRDIQRRIDTARDSEGEYAARMQREADRLTEAIELDNGILDDLVEQGRTRRWVPTDFKPGDEVGYWGGWAPVKRSNKSTVSAVNEHGWIDKVPFDDILGRRRDGEALLDAAPRREATA